MTGPAYSQAGFWGPEAIIYSTNGDPARLVAVKIVSRSTGELATLYTDETKDELAANPTRTDQFGNLSFYTQPGEYDVSLVGSDYTFLALVRPSLADIGSGGSGGGTVSFEHVQVIPQAVWTVQHNLGYRPSAVSVFSQDFLTQYDEYAVHHVNSNQLLISMDVPVSGRALM